MIYLKYIMLYYHNSFLSSVNAIRHGLSVSVLPNLRASRFLKKAKNGLRLKMKNKATYGNSQDYKMLHFSLIYFFSQRDYPKRNCLLTLTATGFYADNRYIPNVTPSVTFLTRIFMKAEGEN